nr:hypothetical protein NCPCFENI_01351 [Cupriavidus sp.]
MNPSHRENTSAPQDNGLVLVPRAQWRDLALSRAALLSHVEGVSLPELCQQRRVSSVLVAAWLVGLGCLIHGGFLIWAYQFA